MLISIAVTGISYLIFAQANTLVLLIASRILAGIGAANISTANAFISDITIPENRSKNFGLVGAAFGLGFIFGPPLGGFLKDGFGIASVGYVSAGLIALNFILAFFLLPESLKEFSKNNSLLPRPFADFKAIRQQKNIGGFMFSNFIFVAAFSMMHITASLLWQEKYQLSESEIGYVFAFIGIAVAVVQGTLIGPATKLLGEKKLFFIGSFLMAIGLVAMPFVPVNLFIPLELVALLLLALGNGFFTPTVSSLVSQQAKPSEQGKMMGLLQSVGSLSRVIGPILGGSLYAIHLSLPYIVAALMMLMVTALGFFMIQRFNS